MPGRLGLQGGSGRRGMAHWTMELGGAVFDSEEGVLFRVFALPNMYGFHHFAGWATHWASHKAGKSSSTDSARPSSDHCSSLSTGASLGTYKASDAQTHLGTSHPLLIQLISVSAEQLLAKPRVRF